MSNFLLPQMTGVTAVGQSNILPVQSVQGRQVLQVDNSDIDFNIGRVFIHMNNLFNGENELLGRHHVSWPDWNKLIIKLNKF